MKSLKIIKEIEIEKQINNNSELLAKFRYNGKVFMGWGKQHFDSILFFTCRENSYIYVNTEYLDYSMTTTKRYNEMARDKGYKNIKDMIKNSNKIILIKRISHV